MGGTQVAQQFVHCEEVSDLSRPALGADLRIHDLADTVVADKEARDTWEAEQAARVCGCPQCRCAHRSTLAFYATLGSRQPACERLSAGYLNWYTFHLSGGQLERT
jgi:hypothetical protein